LHEGREPGDIVKTLIAGDGGRESRQLHIMDAKGRIAAHTGRECVDWCGHIQGVGFSIAGNMLPPPPYSTTPRKPMSPTPNFRLAQRLIAAMHAGEAAAATSAASNRPRS